MTPNISIPFLSSSGCSGHHYGESDETGKFRVRKVVVPGGRYPGAFYYVAEKEVELTCEHSGCSGTKTRWESISARVSAEDSANHRDEVHADVRTDEFVKEETARDALRGAI